MSAPNRCSESVFDAGFGRGRPCVKAAKVERDGKWYCGVHDPERREAKKRETAQRWALKSAADRARWNVESAEKLVAEAVASFGGELPRPIAEARTILLARRASLRACNAQLEALSSVSRPSESGDTGGAR